MLLDRVAPRWFSQPSGASLSSPVTGRGNRGKHECETSGCGSFADVRPAAGPGGRCGPVPAALQSDDPCNAGSANGRTYTAAAGDQGGPAMSRERAPQTNPEHGEG